jgi:hypothetical protein
VEIGRQAAHEGRAAADRGQRGEAAVAIASNIPDLSAHPATSSVLDPLQCLVLSLGEGNEAALQCRRRTS